MQALKISVLFCWVVVFSCAQQPAVNADRLEWSTRKRLYERETEMDDLGACG